MPRGRRAVGSGRSVVRGRLTAFDIGSDGSLSDAQSTLACASARVWKGPEGMAGGERTGQILTVSL